MKNAIFFLLLAALIPSTSHAGNKDGYKQTFQDLTLLAFTDPDSAIEIANNLLPQIYAQGDLKSLSQLLKLAGNAYQSLEKYEPALSYFLKALAIDNLRKDTSSVAMDYALIGFIQRDLGRFHQGMASFQTSYKIYSSLSDFKNMAGVMTNIASSYYEDTVFGYNKQALYCFDKVEELYTLAGKIERFAPSINAHRGFIYFKTKQYDSSWYYFNKALNLLDKKGTTQTLTHSYSTVFTQGSQNYILKKATIQVLKSTSAMCLIILLTKILP